MNLMGAISGRMGRHDLAAEWMSKAVALRPSDATFSKNYATALLELDRLDDAAKVVDDSIPIVSDDSQLLVLRGLILGRQGDLDGAASILTKAVEQDPKSSNAHFNLSVIFRRKADKEQTLKHLKKAVELNPENAEATNDLAGVLLSLIHI